jgi:hypothetical protein
LKQGMTTLSFMRWRSTFRHIRSPHASRQGCACDGEVAWRAAHLDWAAARR